MQTLCDGGGINEVTSTQATCDVLVDVSHLHGVLREKQVHITFHSRADIHDSTQDHKMQSKLRNEHMILILSRGWGKNQNGLMYMYKETERPALKWQSF